MTPGVQALSPRQQLQLLQLVRSFDQFTPDNAPYGEHDFGKVSLGGTDYFWKINYYDHTLTCHSPDPSPNATRRVLVLMRADEY